MELLSKLKSTYQDLSLLWKITLTLLLSFNIMVNVIFKYLLQRIAKKNEPLHKNPMNWLILLDEFEKLLGCIFISGKFDGKYDNNQNIDPCTSLLSSTSQLFRFSLDPLPNVGCENDLWMQRPYLYGLIWFQCPLCWRFYHCFGETDLC